MSIFDYFRSVSIWSPERVRQFVKERNPGEFNLIDVRTPKEYEEVHLPGAELIPIGEMAKRISEIDPDKPTIVYCAAGVRSRSAAIMLSGAGFENVHSMEGGIRAWKGFVAEGAPQSGMAFFAPATKPEELIALAWYLEDGSRRFYTGVIPFFKDKEAGDIYHQLAKAEEHHQSSLLNLYEEISGKGPDPEFPESVLSAGEEKGDVMEGGMRVSEALEWAREKQPQDVLELSISLEINAYDLYLKMQSKARDKNSAMVFHVLSLEENQHATVLSALFEKRFSKPGPVTE
jgi:rhodanese-related sulfurtransferase/rubrerythrin